MRTLSATLPFLGRRMVKSFTIRAALMKSWFNGQHRWRLQKHRATGPDGCCQSSANGFGAACGGIKTGRYGFMILLSTSLAACLARQLLMMPERQSGSCAQVRKRGRRRFRSKGDQIQASPIICQLGSSSPAAGLQSNGRDTSKSAAAKAFAAWGQGFSAKAPVSTFEIVLSVVCPFLRVSPGTLKLLDDPISMNLIQWSAWL